MRRTSYSSSARSTSASAPGGVFDVELVEERAGIVVLKITGKGAAVLFENESGGHRWQHVPAHDKRGRVQTSTITIAVMDELDRPPPAIRREDLDEEFMRGSGAGGQNRNKRDTAVRLRHIPTGLEVRCESERTQGRNRELAMVALKVKIAESQAILDSRIANGSRREQVGSGMRGDKRRTIRVQDDSVQDTDGRTWRFKAYARGDW